MFDNFEDLIGIPLRIRRNRAKFIPYVDDVQFKERMSTYQKQTDTFIKQLENPLESNEIYLLSCNHNNMLPQLAAKAVVDRARKLGGVPFWYSVIKNQKLEDKRLYDLVHEYQSQIDLLVIDGIYATTNINNIDKLRGLLTTFDGIPIYVIISGGFGPEVFEDKVFYSYNKFIHFRDIPRRVKKDYTGYEENEIDEDIKEELK